MKSYKLFGILMLLVMLALASLACGLNELTPTTSEEIVTAEPMQPVEPATNQQVEQENQEITSISLSQEEEIYDPEIGAITMALYQRFDVEAAFIAVAAAMERGYTISQIEAASLAGQLEANGTVLIDGDIQPPESSPLGLLDLSELEAYKQNQLSNPKNAPTFQNGDETLSPRDLLTELMKASEDSPDDAVARTYLIVPFIISLARSGYSPEEITLSMMNGDFYSANVIDNFIRYNVPNPDDDSPYTCSYMSNGNGSLLRPSNGFSQQCFGSIYEDHRSKTNGSPTSEEGESTGAGSGSESGEEGDVDLFCEIYSEFSADVERSVEAYAEAADCVGDCGADQIRDDLVIRMDGYIDQLAEVAPTEIKETMTQLAADTLAGIFSSEGRPELEPLLEAMDNYAGEKCGISFAGE